MWYAIPYNIFGASLWAVENDNGYISKYCSTKEDAEAIARMKNSGYLKQYKEDS